MGLHTGTVKGLSRAPYRTQVLTHLIDHAVYEADLTEKDEAKIARVQKFLPAASCAREIADARAQNI